MTRLLLDHPWPLDAGLDAGSPAHNKLRVFDDLTHRLRVHAVPFITPEERNAVVNRLESHRNGYAAAAIRRLADQLVYHGSNTLPAKVAPAPTNLDDTWLRSLHDEVTTCATWRYPQIIFTSSRRPDWDPAPTEVRVQCGVKTADCVLASLEEFDSHKFALSDIDPWKQRHELNREPAGGDPDHPKPCWLPRHPALERARLEDFPVCLEKLRARDWDLGTRCYFIPPDTYDPLAISKTDWRDGKAFERRPAPERRGTGYRDSGGQIWVWAPASAGNRGERHWDVQLLNGDRVNVSHDGRKL